MIEADQCMINNQVFIVMEYCGQDLACFIRNRMDILHEISVVKDFLYQILSGIEAIHRCGLVHRDIKPGIYETYQANILISDQNNSNFSVKIADFGLGRRLEPVVGCYTPDVTFY
jgi:serine/threonine protein kinase